MKLPVSSALRGLLVVAVPTLYVVLYILFWPAGEASLGAATQALTNSFIFWIMAFLYLAHATIAGLFAHEAESRNNVKMVSPAFIGVRWATWLVVGPLAMMVKVKWVGQVTPTIADALVYLAIFVALVFFAAFWAKQIIKRN